MIATEIVITTETDIGIATKIVTTAGAKTKDTGTWRLPTPVSS